MKNIKEAMAEIGIQGFHHLVIYPGWLVSPGRKVPKYLGYRASTGAVALWDVRPPFPPPDAVVLEVVMEVVSEGFTLLATKPEGMATTNQAPVYPRLAAVRWALSRVMR